MQINSGRGVGWPARINAVTPPRPADELRAPNFNVVSSSLLDDDKPCSHDWTLWAAATSALRRRFRACGWCRSGTALGLEQVRIVRHRINGDCLRAGERGDRRHLRVL